MVESVRTLCVDNSPFDRRLGGGALEKEYGVFEITQTKSRQEFERLLAGI